MTIGPGPGPGKPKYATDEQRKNARRATYSKAQRRRWNRYRTICEEQGFPLQKEWQAHLSKIAHLEAKPGPPETMPPENVELWHRHDDLPLHQWWLENFTLNVIHRLARGLGDGEARPVDERVGFCEGCDNEFALRGRGSHNRRFCSKACQGKWWETHSPAGIAFRQKSNAARTRRRQAA